MEDSPRRCKKGSSTPQKGEHKGINREFASIFPTHKAMVNNKFDLEPTKERWKIEFHSRYCRALLFNFSAVFFQQTPPTRIPFFHQNFIARCLINKQQGRRKGFGARLTNAKEETETTCWNADPFSGSSSTMRSFIDFPFCWRTWKATSSVCTINFRDGFEGITKR